MSQVKNICAFVAKSTSISKLGGGDWGGVIQFWQCQDFKSSLSTQSSLGEEKYSLFWKLSEFGGWGHSNCFVHFLQVWILNINSMMLCHIGAKKGDTLPKLCMFFVCGGGRSWKKGDVFLCVWPLVPGQFFDIFIFIQTSYFSFFSPQRYSPHKFRTKTA